MGKKSPKKGYYYCNTDKMYKPIPKGYKVRDDGFLVKEGWSSKYKKSIDCDNPKGFSQKAHCAGKKKMTEESNPRIARKKGQPAKSKKHSDLYTDEDPKGTIHGLGFKDVATAKASVAKIRKSSRSHAHKIQAAIAMEQRARVMGKTAEAAVYRKFINSMKKKTKAMNEGKSHKGDHEHEMIRRQTDNVMVSAKKIKKKVGKGEGEVKAWVQSKITKAADYLDTAADYMTNKDEVKEGSLHKWFSGSKSKDGKGGWVNVRTGGTCASDEPGEGVPKCVSRSKYDSMSKKERESAARRKKAADPNQQKKRGAAKPTYVATDKPKKKKMKEEFISLPLQLEVPQNDGEFKLGLMFRESLEQDRGMLFIFEDTDYHSFHMKNTLIPLDIAFINEEGIIESIKELDPMNPIPVYPDGEIRYAIEVNRGWFAENGVVVGDAILEVGCQKCGESCDNCECECHDTVLEAKDKKGKGSGTKDACYHKVKSRYSVWPSAYASGALVKCRKVGAANWGNSAKEEVEYEYEVPTKGHYSWRDSISEHHRKDEDGNTIPHEGDDLKEYLKGIDRSIKGKSTTDPSDYMGSFKQDAKYIPKHTGQSLYRGGKAIVGGIKAGLTGGKTPELGKTDYEKVLQGRMEKSNLKKYGTKNPKMKGQVRRLRAVSIEPKTELGKTRAVLSTPKAKLKSDKLNEQSPMDQLNPGASRVKARFKAREAQGRSGLTGQPKSEPQTQTATKVSPQAQTTKPVAQPVSKTQPTKQSFVDRVKSRLGQVKQGVSQAAGGVKKVAGAVGSAARAAGSAVGGVAKTAGGAVKQVASGASKIVGGVADAAAGQKPMQQTQQTQTAKPVQQAQTAKPVQQQSQTAKPAQNLPPSQRGGNKSRLIQRLKDKKANPNMNTGSEAGQALQGALKEGHYGKAVNKIPAELDKAVGLHKSQAERLRKSPEFKKDAGETANKIPGQLDKAVAMHKKQAQQLRASGVGDDKNCGCGQTPCKTYGKKKEMKKSVKEHSNFRSAYQSIYEPTDIDEAAGKAVQLALKFGKAALKKGGGKAVKSAISKGGGKGGGKVLKTAIGKGGIGGPPAPVKLVKGLKMPVRNDRGLKIPVRNDRFYDKAMRSTKKNGLPFKDAIFNGKSVEKVKPFTPQSNLGKTLGKAGDKATETAKKFQQAGRKTFKKYGAPAYVGANVGYFLGRQDEKDAQKKKNRGETPAKNEKGDEPATPATPVKQPTLKGTVRKEEFSDWRTDLEEKCWPGYEKKGMKTMFGKRYPNCVKKSKKKTRKEEIDYDGVIEGAADVLVKTATGVKKPKDTGVRSRSQLDRIRAVYVGASYQPEGEVIDEKKMTKKQMKKRDEIADAIGKKDMKKRYGDENVRYAIATKLAMKEDITDEALTIQDWNVDDIKFTEIETVDVIKAKPLKEGRSDWRSQLDDDVLYRLGEDWQKVNRKDKTDGLSKKAVKAYRRENPGSKLQTAVTTKPSKLKKGSKSAKRRLSFCRRMKGMKKKLTSAKTRRDPDSRINKALRRWNC